MRDDKEQMSNQPTPEQIANAMDAESVRTIYMHDCGPEGDIWSEYQVIGNTWLELAHAIANINKNRDVGWHELNAKEAALFSYGRGRGHLWYFICTPAGRKLLSAELDKFEDDERDVYEIFQAAFPDAKPAQSIS